MASTQVYWINAEGTVLNLNDRQKFWALRGWQDFHHLPVDINSYEVPLRAGEAFSSVELKPREVDLPLFVISRSRPEFMEDYRSLVSAFNPELGAGILRVITLDGKVRDLNCRYKSGLGGNTAAVGWSPGSAQLVLTLRASDPFWYESAAISLSFTQSPPVPFFPIFPIKFTQGTIFNTGGNFLTNPGDSTAWPVWTITGPGNFLKLSNLTTGYKLQSNLALASAQQLVIDTRPGVKTVKREDGSSQFATLSDDSLLWGLQRGDNEIAVVFDGSTSESQVSVTYQAPYFGI